MLFVARKKTSNQPWELLSREHNLHLHLESLRDGGELLSLSSNSSTPESEIPLHIRLRRRARKPAAEQTSRMLQKVGEPG